MWEKFTYILYAMSNNKHVLYSKIYYAAGFVFVGWTMNMPLIIVIHVKHTKCFSWHQKFRISCLMWVIYLPRKVKWCCGTSILEVKEFIDIWVGHRINSHRCHFSTKFYKKIIILTYNLNISHFTDKFQKQLYSADKLKLPYNSV